MGRRLRHVRARPAAGGDRRTREGGAAGGRGGAADDPRRDAVAVDVLVLTGSPANVLLEQSRDAELLVLGHRGRGGFASAMLGSVGLQCVLHGAGPVTIVRPEK